ncbi:hypothetical protein VXM60_04200 [Shewanella khirikhana]|uniref:hypothetical protein n=1 Tax=Shewanella khirikhana TaxID=1965282 RepID=UPI0030D320A4
MKRMLVLPITAAFLASLFWYSEGALGAQSSQNSHSPVGSWENKDEDGDGVPDDQDDYPFDKTKSKYTKFKETEFNNNLSVATPIDSGVPFTVTGNVQQKNDTDLYKFTSEADQTITVLLTSNNVEFDPYITIFDNKGESIQLLPTNYKPIGRHKAVGTFSLRYSGDYYLVVNDKDRNGGTDFNYQVSVFTDSDVDGIDDAIESAFGFLPGEQDSDDDRVFDSNEFYVYEYDEVYSHDVDRDGIPNWLDDDSDADGIKDRLEGAFDFDLDGAPSFADLDSDGNGSNDTSDAGGDVGSPKDLDNDGLFDFYDTDDDSDGLLDVNDLEPTVRNKQKLPGEDGYISIYDVSYVLSGEKVDSVNIAGEVHSLAGNGFADNGMLVFNMGGNKSPLNISIRAQSANEIFFKLPRFAKSVYYISASGNRSNALNINYVSEWTPLMKSLPKKHFEVGEEIELVGKNFFEDTQIQFGKSIIIPEKLTATKLSFKVPDNTAQKATISLRTSWGSSNKLTVNIVRNVRLALGFTPEVDNMKLIAVSSYGSLGKNYRFEPESGTITMPVTKDYDVVVILYQDDSGVKMPYLYALALPGTQSLEIDAFSSAASEIWYISDMNRRTSQSLWSEYFGKIKSLPEVVKMANYLQQHSDEPNYASHRQYLELTNQAKAAAIKLITAN